MVSKCANPACNAKFRYLHEGKLFMIGQLLPRAQMETNGGPNLGNLYWLCEVCARELTVKVGENHSVRLLPRSETHAVEHHSA
jgi:hypothetical protein